jgi:hypothetical protein
MRLISVERDLQELEYELPEHMAMGATFKRVRPARGRIGLSNVPVLSSTAAEGRIVRSIVYEWIMYLGDGGGGDIAGLDILGELQRMVW